MVTILRNIVRACFDKNFYQESEKDSFGRRFAHLYVLFVIVMIVLSVQLVGVYISKQGEIKALPQKVTTFLNTLYPEDLVLRFNKNELSINQPEPYIVGKNFDVKGSDTDFYVNEEATTENGTNAMKHLITIDTNASIDDFDEYQSLALAMKNGLAVKQSNRAEVRYYSYAEFLEKVPQPFTFDSVSYGQIVNKVRPYINQIPTLLLYVAICLVILAILIAPLFLVLGVLFNVLFLALLGYLIASAMKRKHTYKYIYKLGMYTAIPVIILQQVVSYIPFNGFDSIWWLIALLIMVVFIPQSGGPLATVNQTPSSPMDPPKVV
jgi:hypothetical protein